MDLEQGENVDTEIGRQPDDDTGGDQDDDLHFNTDNDGEADRQQGRHVDARSLIMKLCATSHSKKYDLLDLNNEKATADEAEEIDGTEANLENEDDFLIPIKKQVVSLAQRRETQGIERLTRKMRTMMVAQASRLRRVPPESKVTLRLRLAIAVISAVASTQIWIRAYRNGDSTDKLTFPRRSAWAAMAASGWAWISSAICLLNREEQRTKINSQGVNLPFTVVPDLWEGAQGALCQSRLGATAGSTGRETSEERKEGKSSGHWRVRITRGKRLRGVKILQEWDGKP